MQKITALIVTLFTAFTLNTASAKGNNEAFLSTVKSICSVIGEPNTLVECRQKGVFTRTFTLRDDTGKYIGVGTVQDTTPASTIQVHAMGDNGTQFLLWVNFTDSTFSIGLYQSSRQTLDTTFAQSTPVKSFVGKIGEDGRFYVTSGWTNTNSNYVAKGYPFENAEGERTWLKNDFEVGCAKAISQIKIVLTDRRSMAATKTALMSGTLDPNRAVLEIKPSGEVSMSSRN